MKAGSLDEALGALKSDQGATLIAGGMTLIPVLKQRMADPTRLVDISGLDELKGTSVDGGDLVIGAMTTHAEVHASELVREKCPALADLAGMIGDPAVRNRGTLGGALAVSDPAADYPAAVLGLNAIIKTDRREITSDDYFIDLFETALEEGEIILELRFPLPGSASYIKLSQPASRFAIAGVFVARFKDAVRVAVTGVGPCAFRFLEAEKKLTAEFSIDVLQGLEISDIEVNSDIHAGVDYRARMVQTLTVRAVEALIGQ